MRLLAAIALILSTAFSAPAHYGAKFEPPDGRIYHGSGWDFQSSQRRYEEMFPGDKRPLVLQVNISIPGTRGVDVPRLVQSLRRGIVHPDSQFIEFSMHWQGRDALQMLDSVYVFTDQWDRYVDSLEIAFRQVNRPFFFRIGFEFNGAWNPYHPYIFPMAFRKIVTDLRERGIDNFATVWCYEPDAPGDFADSTRQGWKWYPGDDVVDWFGLDLFQVEHFHPDLPDSGRGGITKKGKSEAFLRFAEARGKPVYLNEFSSIHTSSTPDSLDREGDDGRADWDAFFVPFFRFVENHSGIKGWNYINVNWGAIDSYAQQGWRDARLDVNRILRENWVNRMTEDRFIHAGWDVSQELGLPSEEIGASPETFGLIAAYPNPFNGDVTLEYSIDRAGDMQLALFDLNGRLEKVLANGREPAGGRRVVWRADGVPSGVYLLRLSGGGKSSFLKLTIVR